jgi:hypothetical protein
MYETKREKRFKNAVLLALYKNDPVGMTESEILAAIVRDGLLEMSDAEFERYHRNLVIQKQMMEKGRLN